MVRRSDLPPFSVADHQILAVWAPEENKTRGKRIWNTDKDWCDGTHVLTLRPKRLLRSTSVEAPTHRSEAILFGKGSPWK